ncbi:unnamed protein product [Toxocara canis]|uniref:CASP-like protein n=1 Tax=Toxocara canis TaxID=6265 RepID=A0A183U608_TOXCA|nr:unnamed protein product [Toxocara canis]
MANDSIEKNSKPNHRLRLSLQLVGTSFAFVKMINSRTATWTVFVFELVLSTAAFMASLAIICAQLQSISNYEDRKSPRF